MMSFALLLLGAVGAAAQREYQECETSNECTKSGFPICSRYFVDTTFADPDDFRPYGFCAQCQTDCDCGVNEYCAREFMFPSLQLKNNNLPDGSPLAEQFDYETASLEGIMMPSICKKIKRKGGRAFANVGTPVAGESDESFCGIVGEYQPEEIPCTGICPNVENPTADIPGFCARRLFDEDDNLQVTGGCASTLTLEDVTITEPQWVGIPHRGKCVICAEGDTRCTDSGTPQICFDGQWQSFIYVDDTLRTYGDNTVAQQMTVLAVGIALVLATMCFFGFKSA